MLLEQAVQIQKDLYQCFIDYRELFDNIRRDELLQILEKIYSHEKYIVLIRCIYWEERVFTRIEKMLSAYTKTRKISKTRIRFLTKLIEDAKRIRLLFW